MSLNGALQSGVSGLLANSTALSAISNDIANTNTVGFKSGGVDFQSIVASAGGANFSSGGVTASSQQLVNQQGTTIQTSSPTDLYISGQGLFVTSNKPTAAANAQVLYTRAGSFTPDATGFLKNSAGLYLQGVLADSQGNIPTSGLNIGTLQPINVSNVGGAVSPTTVASLTGTLNADQPISAASAAVPGAGAGAYDPILNSMTAYSAVAGTGVKPDFTMQVPISDSQGGQHTVQVDLLKSSVPDQWYAEIQAVPVSDVNGGTVPGQISVGVLAFNPDGSLDTVNTTLNTVLNFGASAAAAPVAPAVNWAASLGVAAQTVNLSLGSTGATSGMSQVAGASAVASTTANGTPFGALSSIAIGSNGIVTATFTNGVSRAIAEIPLATFPNADGLTAVSGTAYEASNNSGLVSLQAAGTGGSGQLASNTLEASTVDLSSEFTKLIVTQQAYAAASKVISTANQMSQVLLQVIQG
jgi:flagellar hook protein FlgE